jgi:hypothetical protein
MECLKTGIARVQIRIFVISDSLRRFQAGVGVLFVDAHV